MNLACEDVSTSLPQKPDGHIHMKVEFGGGSEGKVAIDEIDKRVAAYKPKKQVICKMIQEYIEEKYGFKIHMAYITKVKRSLGLPMYDEPMRWRN